MISSRICLYKFLNCGVYNVTAAFMKAIVILILSCPFVFAAATNEIQVFTRTDSRISPGNLVTFEEFTRAGQTNLLRVTTTKDGNTNSLAHNFFHRGVYL